MGGSTQPDSDFRGNTLCHWQGHRGILPCSTLVSLDVQCHMSHSTLQTHANRYFNVMQRSSWQSVSNLMQNPSIIGRRSVRVLAGEPNLAGPGFRTFIRLLGKV